MTRLRACAVPYEVLWCLFLCLLSDCFSCAVAGSVRAFTYIIVADRLVWWTLTQPKGLRRRRDAPTGMRRPVRSVVALERLGSVWVGFPFLCFLVCYMIVCVWYVSLHRVLDLVLVWVLSLPWEMFFGTV